MEELRKLQHLSLVSKITSGACWWLGKGHRTQLPGGDWWGGRGRRLRSLTVGPLTEQQRALCCTRWGSGQRERRGGVEGPTPTLSPPPSELENHLGVSDKTMAEFVINLAKNKKTGTEFGEVRIGWEREKQGGRSRAPRHHSHPPPRTHTQTLKQAGGELPDTLVASLWAIIQRLTPGAPRGGGGAGPSSTDDRAARYPGLAMPDTRDRARAMAAELQAAPPPAEAGLLNRAPDRRRSRSPRRRRSRSPRDRRRSSRSPRRDDRSRSRSRDRGRRRRRRASRSPRRRSAVAPPPPPPRAPAAPTVGAIYRGRVTGVVDFGAFVELADAGPPRAEGLVHASAIAPGGLPPGAPVRDTLSRGANVWVKIVSDAGGRLALSMADVDQSTGREVASAPPRAGAATTVNPAAPPRPSALHGLSGVVPPPLVRRWRQRPPQGAPPVVP